MTFRRSRRVKINRNERDDFITDSSGKIRSVISLIMNIVKTEKEVEAITSEAIHTFSDSRGGTIGYLVIDSNINEISGGGVRLVPEISTLELCHLARTMTLKYSFLNLPFGGAKAAIITGQEDLLKKTRQEYIKLFAKELIPFKNEYFPGKDIGLDDSDHSLLLRYAGLKQSGPAPDSAFYTALTARLCAQECAKQADIKLKGSNIAIEGFGKVGSWVGKLFSEIGANIIAISTSKGALYNPQGLNIAELLILGKQFGDNSVLKYKQAQRIPRQDLLWLSTDLLVPCASSWSINLSNVDKIRAKIIVCGANNPVSDKAKTILAHNNILYFPDFVSNCGGVFGSIMESLIQDRVTTTNYIEKALQPKIKNLFRLSKAQKRTLDLVAKDISNTNFIKMKQQEKKRSSRLFAIGAKMFRLGMVPKPLIRRLGPTYLRLTTRSETE